MTGNGGPGLGDGADGRVWPASGPWRWLRLLFSVVWLVYLAQPLATLPAHHHDVWWQAGAVAVTIAFCAVFIVVVTGWDQRTALIRWGNVVLFPLAAAFSALFSGQAAAGHVIWIYVSSATGWTASSRRAALRAVGAIAACYLLFSWLARDDWPDTLITLIPVVFVGLTMSGWRTQITLVRELRRAREEVAKLAANEERLRLARDMHDLTGQSLAVITLKSELAARLLSRLPDGEDRNRALAQAEEVAAVSRQTLRDIREAISGYRRPTLAVEAITARAALASAGIATRDGQELTLLSGTIDPDAEAALAWCLREAITNVVRHSGARNCHIGLTRRGTVLSLRIRDDGRGHVAPGGPLAAPGGPVPGSGLHGMSERLRAVGGALELRPDTAPGFCLIAIVPATALPGVPAPAAPVALPGPGAPGDPVTQRATVT